MARKKKARSRARPTQGYEVGYAKPPVSGQFQKGQSGNPAGRPRGRKDAASMLQDALYGLVQVRQGSEVRSYTRLQAAFMSLANAAAKGDVRSLREALKLATTLGIPLRDVPNTIQIEFVKSNHPRPDDAPEHDVTDEEIRELNRRFNKRR